MQGKILVLILVMLSVGSIVIQPVIGKEYPTKPIEIVCAFTPGSSMDIMARLVADTAPKYLGQPFVVVNKPGAGGSIATADVVSSKPDGYKLLTGANTFFSLTLKTQKVPFSANDVIPIANFMEYKMGMLVRGDSPWKNFNDLLDYGRKNPDKLRWGHTGRGIGNHMNGLLIFRKAGVEAVDIPNKGSPENLAALLGGHLDAACMAYGAIRDYVKTGKLRYMIFFSDHRYSDPSDVPCATELGFPEAGKLAVLVGLYAHKDTPEDIRKTLFNAFKKVYEDPEFRKGLEKLGEEPTFAGPEFLKEASRKQEEVGVPILKELGLYMGK